ncbi:hypothetical protein, partial [Burkholderia pseudomallei]|uniref:hypothetical protein n=1 Tax=Burkholderia pseudomallei TaxID=28450 RepID=UPI001CA4E67F
MANGALEPGGAGRQRRRFACCIAVIRVRRSAASLGAIRKKGGGNGGGGQRTRGRPVGSDRSNRRQTGDKPEANRRQTGLDAARRSTTIVTLTSRRVGGSGAPSRAG